MTYVSLLHQPNGFDWRTTTRSSIHQNHKNENSSDTHHPSKLCQRKIHVVQTELTHHIIIINAIILRDLSGLQDHQLHFSSIFEALLLNEVFLESEERYRIPDYHPVLDIFFGRFILNVTSQKQSHTQKTK